MKIKTNIANIKTSATLAINELSYKLEKKGKDIYKFGLGQSPFPIPELISTQFQCNSAHPLPKLRLLSAGPPQQLTYFLQSGYHCSALRSQMPGLKFIYHIVLYTIHP